MNKACLPGWAWNLNNESGGASRSRVRRTRSYSVRQWVNKEAEETDTTGVRRATGGSVPVFFTVHGSIACGRDAVARHFPPFLPGQAAGRQAPDAAMPPCVWRWHTGRARPPPHLARARPCPCRLPLKRSASIRPSVGQSSAEEGGPGPGPAYAYACTHTHTHHRQKKTIQKPHNPSLSPSCPSLDMPVSLSLSLSLSSSSPLTYFFIVLSWKPTQVTHLSPLSSSSPCVYSLAPLLLLAWCKEKIAHFPQPRAAHLSHPASPPPYLLFCPPTKPKQAC